MEMLVKFALLISILFASTINLQAKIYQQNKRLPYSSQVTGRPNAERKIQNIGRIWSAITNFGSYGDLNLTFPSYDWPNRKVVSYLWEGRIWIGAKPTEGYYCVSHAGYPNYEFCPSEDGAWVINKLGTSMYDIECKYDDWYDLWNSPDRQLGIKIIQKAMSWSVEGFDDFLAYEYKITYVADSSFHHSDTLKQVYVAWVFDADCGGRIYEEHNIDDLVHYDGWVANEWTDAYRPYSHSIGPYPYDEVTLYADGTIDTVPDGILDQVTVFGDEPNELTLHGDTLFLWRNFSYIYDGDNRMRAGDDRGEYGTVPGYIGGIVLYAPPSPNDSVWIDEHGDTCRIIRPMGHQWWDWESDPHTDTDKYLYMIGKHPLSGNYRFMPHPFVWGITEYDYRFMHTYGPYEIADGDTLEFVFAGLMGFGLNGGYGYDKGVEEGIFEQAKWYPGIRWVADQALKAYYLGSKHSDPIHPSSPSEDIHWLIQRPPEIPHLEYSASRGVVTLVWTDIAERTPDPIDGMYDFVGYRIYKAEFKPRQWQLIKGFVDSAFASENTDSFPSNIYEWIGVKEPFPHSYTDTTAIYGIPYFYVVTSFDMGRPPLIPSIESAKINYKQTEFGDAIPIFVKTEKLEEPLTTDKLSTVTVVPNPYLGSVQWERKREDRIHFINLPGSCRILIFTVSGDLVRKIEHTDGTGDEYWDLTSKTGRPVKSGLYVYKLEARDERNKPIYKFGKFVLVR